MAERRYGEAPPKTEITIAGADWYGRQIERERHQNTLFTDLDLTEAQTVGVVFHECTFRRARFNASSHQASAFVNCTFVSCKFFDSRFTECKFVGSMFDACDFDQMQVAGGDWSFVGLPGAALGRASFKDTRLREADLTGASCKGGSLRMSTSPAPGYTVSISRPVTSGAATSVRSTRRMSNSRMRSSRSTRPSPLQRRSASTYGGNDV